MSVELPYRPDNHYVFPKTPLEVMDDHIAFYPDGAEFRWSIIGLRNLYKDTPFMKLMEEYARLMKVAKVEASGAEARINPKEHDTYFLAGSVMAMHTMLYGAPTEMRRHILLQNPLSELRTTPDCKEKADFLTQTVEVMKEWCEEGAASSYQAQTDEFKEKLLELSIYAFNDMEKPEGKDDDFVSGFMFASELIWRFSHQASPPV